MGFGGIDPVSQSVKGRRSSLEGTPPRTTEMANERPAPRRRPSALANSNDRRPGVRERSKGRKSAFEPAARGYLSTTVRCATLAPNMRIVRMMEVAESGRFIGSLKVLVGDAKVRRCRGLDRSPRVSRAAAGERQIIRAIQRTRPATRSSSSSPALMVSST